MSLAPGFDVTMYLWVEDNDAGHTLVEPARHTLRVQPPAWCYDDRVALEMHLDHLAKLQYLFGIRRSIRQGEAIYQHLKEREDIIVRGMMEMYVTPVNSEGKVTTIRFNPLTLRAA